MADEARSGRRPVGVAAAAAGRLGRAGSRALTTALGGKERTRVILLLASVLALASADTTTVGASAIQLRHDLGINNTDVGLLVTVTSPVAAAAGPIVASLVGDWFAASERGRIYSYVLSGELIGAAIGFSVTGGIATLSWRAAFVILALPAFVLAWLIFQLPEPARGGTSPLLSVGAEPPPVTQPGDEDGEQTTDAQRIARDRGLEPDPELVLTEDPRQMGLLAATRYVLSIKTNVAIILASAGGYYFLSGVQTFGVEFVTKQYGIAQALSTLVLLVIGAAGVLGVLAGGALGDFLLHRGYLNGRILVSAISATAAVILFIPAIFTRDPLTALPYICLAAIDLSEQIAPIDAARLDIVHPLLWGRAEGIRTGLRTLAQATAPLLFGALSDYVFGGGRSGLQWTFAFMLLPLAASAYFLFKALRTHPHDVATAAAATAGSG